MIRIAHLYYDLMNLYGENGNVKCLEKYLTKQNINVEVSYLTKDDKMKFLDDFLNFYEWCILKSDDKENMYMIYDLQTNEIKDYDDK